MAIKGKIGKSLIISIVGVILVILGVLWITVIFPALDKLPTDYERDYFFDCVYQEWNAATRTFDVIPAKMTRTQEAVGTEDGALLIREVRSVVNTDTGEVMPRYAEESILAVDRSTNEFVTEIDERGRWGYWGPPRPLEEGDTFDMWNPGALQTLEAIYVERVDFCVDSRCMDVFKYNLQGADIPIGVEPQSGGTLTFTADIDLWVEPTSGTVVYQESDTSTSLETMGMTFPVQISHVQYADETREELMDIGESARTMLFWFKGMLPLILIIIGAVLVVGDVIIISIRRKPED